MKKDKKSEEKLKEGFDKSDKSEPIEEFKEVPLGQENDRKWESKNSKHVSHVNGDVSKKNLGGENKNKKSEKKSKKENKVQHEISQLTFKINKMQSENSDLLKKISEYEDFIKRQQAEFDNYRKRVNEEREATVKYASDQLIKEFLTIYDQFEKAIGVTTDDEELKKYIEGFNLIKDQFEKMLKNNGVKTSTMIGDVFNPEIQKAIQVDDQGGSDEKVIEVYQKGYFLHDRLLREAIVKIQKTN